MTSDQTLVVNASDGASVVVSRFGGHVCQWRTPDGVERLYVSPAQRVEGAPIRGGIPIVFPQFADEGVLPKHGFARTSTWDVTEVSALPNGAQRITLTLGHSPATQVLWPYAFRLDLAVTVGGAVMDVELTVTNTGSARFEFTSALHTYLRVSGNAAYARGLRGLPFLDGTNAGRGAVSDSPRLDIDRPIQRYYYGAAGPVSLIDDDTVVTVHQEGFRDIVVWNPWDQGPERFPDLPPHAHRHFVCIESAAIEHPVTLAAGAKWRGCQRLDTSLAALLRQ